MRSSPTARETLVMPVQQPGAPHPIARSTGVVVVDTRYHLDETLLPCPGVAIRLCLPNLRRGRSLPPAAATGQPSVRRNGVLSTWAAANRVPCASPGACGSSARAYTTTCATVGACTPPASTQHCSRGSDSAWQTLPLTATDSRTGLAPSSRIGSTLRANCAPLVRRLGSPSARRPRCSSVDDPQGLRQPHSSYGTL